MVQTIRIPTVEYLLSRIIDYRTLLEVVYGLFQNCTQVIEVIHAPLLEPETWSLFRVLNPDLDPEEIRL